ncbi:thiamine pyrophosphate-dependent dehydrogenase E1 component subunit alpha [Nakamurella leprariae]|uniref:Thiamine pyrophosphate-dependent dehydrogenase E1 component subunit alpha n=1 Tax=Nakamurella leprariae TaxID=2803911 RepID=A0A938YE55_9ACTN|nr:thiamine pyrophosphate-dependent dehydrogenase E1 component subunit alpha [Nakamurella leprariae]MBM9469052.1 thiamine pyrophosphate-dependent dehydrogenase E1 component subunit alpha [Nakamurella leprariae]
MTDPKTKLDIYRTMVLAQSWEQALMRLIDENLAPASYHPGRGSEGSEVACTMALRESDYLLYDHRGMAHIIAKGVPLVGLFGDFLGNELGTTRGYGAGIVHVADPDRGVLGQSGTLGGSQLIAAGAALSAKIRKTDQVTMCFFGDGAANRGTFHEAANAAGAWKLPLVFVVQNNGWAVSVPTEYSTGGAFVDRANGYGFPGVAVDGQNPFEVHDVAVEAVERARNGGGPTLIEVKTVRLLGHYLGDPQAYREAAERSTSATRDPIVWARAALKESGEATEEQLSAIEAEAIEQVEAAREQALAGAKPTADVLTEYLYV